MLPLKDYQEKALETLSSYLTVLKAAQEKEARQNKALAKEGDGPLDEDWPKQGWKNFQKGRSLAEWQNRLDGCGRPVPNICLKIPTGGGKTLLGVHAVERINGEFFRRNNGLVLWVVPSEAIYSQTLKNFRDPEHPCRFFLKRAAANNSPRVIERHDRFTRLDVDGNLTVMLLTLQAGAISEDKKEGRKFHNESGNHHDILPYPDRHVQHDALLDVFPNLERDAPGSPHAKGYVRHSLANAIRVLRPIVVIDESQNVTTDIRRDFVSGLNPRFILELSATPQSDSNLLVNVPGQALKNEEMIKLPINLYNREQDDWKGTLARAAGKLRELDEKTRTLRRRTNRYIRPIMLIQAEQTGRAQLQDATRIHAEHVRDYLVQKLNFRPDEVRVKSAEKNEIKKENLLADTSPVRAIITKAALQEGWDCSFAYVLALLAKSKATAHRGLTQLTGRVLRQPGAMLTGMDDLDEAHVFCADKDVSEAVKKVQEGLEREGLADADGVRRRDDDTRKDSLWVSAPRRLAFKDVTVFLPRILLGKGKRGGRRLLDYERDILIALPWDDFSFSRKNDRVFQQRRERGATRTKVYPGGRRDMGRGTESVSGRRADSAFFARGLSDAVPNPWVAAGIASDALKAFERRGIEQEKIYLEREDILDEMKQDITERIDEESETLFRAKLKSGDLVFNLNAVDDPDLRWEAENTVNIRVVKGSSGLSHEDGSQLQLSLYDRVFSSELNGLEKDFALYLDENANQAIKYWHRFAARGVNGYPLQGWRKHKIYPDFLACIHKKKDVRTYAILETKGMHLKNEDTEYKEKVFNFLEQASSQAVVTGHITVSRNDGKAMVLCILMANNWKQKMNALTS